MCILQTGFINPTLYIFRGQGFQDVNLDSVASTEDGLNQPASKFATEYKSIDCEDCPQKKDKVEYNASHSFPGVNHVNFHKSP